MELEHLFEEYSRLTAPRWEVLSNPKGVTRISASCGTVRAFASAAIFNNSLQTNALIILNDMEEAGYFYHDLRQLLGDEKVLFFPSSYKRAIRFGQIDSANQMLRTETLTALKKGNGVCVIAYPESLAEKVVEVKELDERSIEIKVGESVPMSFLADQLSEWGFERVDYVYEAGQYAMRGSLIDVFSFSNEYPYRVDFFGDDIDSIREFDVESQLSEQRVNDARIVPNMNDFEASGISLVEFMGNDTWVGYMDLVWLRDRTEQIVREGVATQAVLSEEYDKNVAQKLINPTQMMRSILELTRIEFSNYTKEDVPIIRFNTENQPLYHKNFELLGESFIDYINRGYKLFIFSDSRKQLDRLRTIFEDRGELIRFEPINKAIHEGYIDHDLKFCFFTDHQIFDRYHKYSLKSDRARTGKIALSLKELKQFEIGDYVVHINHGIGKFGGLVRTNLNGQMQELVKLIYKNDDLVFVSIHSLHRLSKYKGKEGAPPQVSKLGGGAWERVKERTKAKVKDIARDLIKLYAERRAQEGFAFSPDSYLQQELEASFLYEDTPDQLKVTADIKADMERSRPMDRLVCGDVGFGKTEVAIRAAFKAVADSKQVAVLVPTTVLAFQHFKSFSSRMEAFPCRVEYLSRARSSKSVKAVLNDLKEGKIDVLVGTHKLIGKDVVFKDLGLLVIDEEQKFGVSVKEKLRQMKSNVDTLTLTATPIPRTLQFSLVGARDFSVIQTPPPNRYPIQTEVHTFDNDILREAINFELSRNGQVFVINNRISNIGEIESLVGKLVPDARVTIGHGQMPPEALEQVILDFQNHEADVLVATTIIESGIDIPNANTIIVCNAQNFGLSELHQLRGRVGRSNRKAFCYLFAPPLSSLSQEARRRLQAIENFAELGSGIHIAMQDLDIRGAGNMLGAEQSGFIADLGYETYQKILQEAIIELRNEEFADLYREDELEREKEEKEKYEYVSDSVVESDMELLFPSEYVPSDSERMLIYREMDNIQDDVRLDEFRRGIIDRFGKVPYQGEELIRVVKLRNEAKLLGYEKVVLKRGWMNLHLVANPLSAYYQSEWFDKLLRFVSFNPRRCEIKEREGKRIITVKNVKNVETALDVFKKIRDID